MNNDSGIKVKITPEAYARLICYIEAVESEISGLGEVELKDGNIIITSVTTLPQMCSAASTDIKDDEFAKWLEDYVKAGGDPSKLRLWWHSHYEMGTFLSPGTDVPTITDILGTTGADWFIVIVGNVKHEFLVNVEIFSPVRFTIKAQLELMVPISEELRAEVAEEVAKNVEEEKSMLTKFGVDFPYGIYPRSTPSPLSDTPTGFVKVSKKRRKKWMQSRTQD